MGTYIIPPQFNSFNFWWHPYRYSQKSRQISLLFTFLFKSEKDTFFGLSILACLYWQLSEVTSHQYSSTDYLIKTFDNGLLMLIFMVFWILANYAKSWINLPSWSLIKYGLPVTRLAVQSSLMSWWLILQIINKSTVLSTMVVNQNQSHLVKYSTRTRHAHLVWLHVVFVCSAV